MRVPDHPSLYLSRKWVREGRGVVCQQAWRHTAPTPSREAATHSPVDTCTLTWAGETLCNSQTGKEIRHPSLPPNLGAAPSGLPAGGWGFHLGEGLLLGSLEGSLFSFLL